VYAVKITSKSNHDHDPNNIEYEVLNTVRHPFIVTLHFFFESKDRRYFGLVRIKTENI